jgi:D-lactate dehydrogenase
MLNMMKIAVVLAEDWEKKYLTQKLTGHELIFIDEPLTAQNADTVKEVEAISVFIYSPVTKELIDKLPNLKLVTTRSTGFDHIDLAYCKRKGITVCNVPHYGTHTVAEHTFALILALSRNILKSAERTKHADFDFKELTGFDLYGKILGIIGLGDIGMSVLKIAKGFGMNVVAFSRHPDEKLARKLGIHFMELKEILPIADIVTLHVPYTKETHHLINKKNIKRFKKGSILINTARGPLVQTEAILYGLEKKTLRGVGLDVLEEETTITEEREILSHLSKSNIRTLLLDHILMTKENCIITPHNAFNSQEALNMILDVTIQNIVHSVNHNPINVVEAK